MLDFAQDQVFSQSGPTLDIPRGDTAINLYRKLYSLYTCIYAQHDWKVNKRLTLNTGLPGGGIFVPASSAVTAGLPPAPPTRQSGPDRTP